MTVRELSKLYYLKKLIDRDAERLAELNAKLQPGATKLDGMPHAGIVAKSLLEEIVAQKIETEEKIKAEYTDYIVKRDEIERYIQSVEDYQIKLILTLRFVDLKSWRRIALSLGGGNTEDSVKKMCYRYVNTH